MKNNTPLLIALAFALVILIVFCTLLKWDGIEMTVQLSQLAGLLAPVAFAAAVVERGVEILISPWRDTEATKLENTITAIKARTADAAAAAQNAEDLKKATDELAEYRGTTQRYAFGVSLILSTLTSVAGVRALGPFVVNGALDALKKSGSPQYGFFLGLDVALTATLLAGGADGVHSVVSAVTTFFDSTSSNQKSKSQNS
jgi:hypothetical protein